MAIKEVVIAGGNEVFLKHCCAAFNVRYAELVTPVAHLALLLHPYYRRAMEFSKKDFGFYQQVAASLLNLKSSRKVLLKLWRIWQISCGIISTSSESACQWWIKMCCFATEYRWVQAYLTLTL